MDGCRLSFGKLKRYQHNDMASLRHAMESLEPDAPALIVSDGIFSMDGDIVKLPEAPAGRGALSRPGDD